MIETIEFRDKNGGLSSTIEVGGSPDEVTVELKRGSPHPHRKIKKNVGLCGKIYEHFLYHSYYNLGNKQKWFEYRIIATIEEFSIIAKEYIKQDEEQIRKILEERKSDEEKTAELKQFIKTVKKGYESPKQPLVMTYHPDGTVTVADGDGNEVK